MEFPNNTYITIYLINYKISLLTSALLAFSKILTDKDKFLKISTSHNFYNYIA